MPFRVGAWLEKLDERSSRIRRLRIFNGQVELDSWDAHAGSHVFVYFAGASLVYFMLYPYLPFYSLFILYPGLAHVVLRYRRTGMEETGILTEVTPEYGTYVYPILAMWLGLESIWYGEISTEYRRIRIDSATHLERGEHIGPFKLLPTLLL